MKLNDEALALQLENRITLLKSKGEEKNKYLIAKAIRRLRKIKEG